jgi:hypothetical protein
MEYETALGEVIPEKGDPDHTHLPDKVMKGKHLSCHEDYAEIHGERAPGKHWKQVKLPDAISYIHPRQSDWYGSTR